MKHWLDDKYTKRFLTCFLIGLLAIFVAISVKRNTELSKIEKYYIVNGFEGKTGTIDSTTWENKYLNLGFHLPDGYNFEDNEAKTLKIKDNWSVIEQFLYEPFICDLVIAANGEAKDYVYVNFSLDKAESYTRYKYIQTGKNRLEEYAYNAGGYEVSVTDETVTFCGEKISVAMVSFIQDEEPAYILNHFEDCGDGILDIMVYGKTKEEAEMLLNNFYKLKE